MLPICFTARTCLQGEVYRPLEETALTARTELLRGEGTAKAPWVLRATIRNGGPEPWRGVIRLDCPFDAADPRFFLPGFLYGTNRGDAPLVTDSKTPRVRRSPTEFPASPWWLVRSDRLSHPAALVFTGEQVIGLSASPYYVLREGRKCPWRPGAEGAFCQYAGFGCDIDRQTVSYTLGYENAPWFFLHSHAWQPRGPLDGNAFRLEPGEEVAFHIAVFAYAAADERGIHAALRWVYDTFRQPPRRGAEARRVIGDIAQAVFRDAWMPEREAYAGFVFDRPEGYELRALPSIAWTNGLAAAVPLLQAALRLHREDIRSQALRCIGRIAARAINPRNGLPYTVEQDGRWSNRGWWYDRQPTPGHSAYLVGQAVYLLLKAWDAERRLAGCDHPEWLAFAASVLEVTERSRNGDDEYPYFLSEQSGAGLCYDAFGGAWCLAAAAYYTHLTGDRRFLPGLLRSERHYHEAYVAHAMCWGGPLDIDGQMDSEGILAYLRAVRLLHAVTGDADLLAHMRDALLYEFTFKFCYNSPIRVPPLSRVGWSSCGGSITSVTNPHIHPMSSSVLDELLYYVQQTDDAYVRSRLEDTLRWSCQVSSTRDREYDYGRTGWMSERFCHCEGLLTETYPDGSPASTWFALMPWACGCILEGLCGDLFPLVCPEDAAGGEG